MKKLISIIGAGLLLSVGACGSDRDRDRDRDRAEREDSREDRDPDRAERDDRGEARDRDRAGPADRDEDRAMGGVDPVVGRYVDGPAGSPCVGPGLATFVGNGNIIGSTGAIMGTWRREGGRLTVTQEGDPPMPVTETAEGLVVEGDLLRRC